MFDPSTISLASGCRAPKGIVYGPPGVGKTTFGIASGGIVLDAENGIPNGVQCLHTPYLKEWPDIRAFLEYLVSCSELPAALIVDTIDWVLRRMEEHVSGTDSTVKGLSATLNKAHGGYGNGKQVLQNYAFQYLLPMLDTLCNRGVAIILLAHATRRELTAVDGAVYERSMPQIHHAIADTMIEWSDFVGAAVKVSNQRQLILQETNQLVAKNRYGVSQPVPLDWNTFVSEITNNH